ncbi:MAG: autotransporter adhesin family protein, partial [Clostridia bacterium]|nr:autotransporter adhesin family protein [Clostridia bacterium]
GYKNGSYVEILSFEAGAVIVEHADGSIEVSSSAEEALSGAVSGDTMILYDDVVWSDCDFGGNVWYEVGSGVELTIDLNGHNIELDSDAYRAFRVYGTLNLTDSSGVYETYTGNLEPGVYQNDDGTFTTIYKMTDEITLETSAYSYTSGAIYGGTNTTNSTQYYGAIYVGENGALNIYGGTITGNTHCYGGGVYVRGGNSTATSAYFAMYGGSISGNTTTRHASALYFGYNTDAYIYGGIVTSNTVTPNQYGGAVYTYSGVNLYVYEDTDVPTVFSHNTAYYGGGLALNTSTVCDVYGGHFEFNSVTNGGAIYTWSDAKLNVRGGYFANNTAADHGGAFYVRGEFNMYGGTVQGNVSTSSTYGAGAVLVNNENGTAVFNMYGGTITNNTSRSHYGGGVAVDYGGTFNMYGGEISYNTASSDGGGIYITSRGGEVHLYGGKVSGNTADYGGGVYIASGTLYVEGGTIDGNSAAYGGGVYSYGDVYIYDGGVVNNSTTRYYGGGIYMSAGTTLVIEDGFVYNNTASYGGGIYSFGDVYMNGGYVSGNTASGDGGGINVRENASMTMTGGHITDNVSNGTSWGGGGILVNYNASFVMADGEIARNTAVSYGAGVYLGHGSSFTMTGGEIRENSAGTGAAGVFTQTCTCHDICVVEVGGKAVIRDNVLTSGNDSNVVLIQGQYINLVSDLERGSYVGFTLSSGTQVTSAESGTSHYLNSYTHFHPDDDALTVGYSSAGGYVEIISAEGAAAVVRYGNGTFGLASTYEDALDAAKADSENAAGTVVLMRDVYYDDIYGSNSGSVGYGISSGEYLNIDLNGHSIILSSTNERAFTVNGYLSLDDSTGYYSKYSGEKSEGVYDNGDGTFTTIYRESDPDTCATSLYSYTSGAITASSGGTVGRSYGAIYVKNGKFDMFGGSIVLNSELYGAVCVEGGDSSKVATTVFNMYGGSISGNGSDAALSLGGGVTVGYATFNMYGGIVSGNGSANYGGIYVTNDFVLYIGSPSDTSEAELVEVTPVISGNTSGGIGGGISVVPWGATGSVTINGANIEYNTSKTSGGGIYLETTESVTVDAFVGYNEAGTIGGGIYVKSGSVMFTGGKIYSNSAESSGYGGAGVYVSSGASFSLTGGIVSQNVSAGYGGGVYLESGSDLLVSGAEISFNTAASMGGGVYALGTLSVSGEAVIRDNTAKGIEENVLLSKDNYIVLAGTLSGDAYIGVSFADSSQTQITSEETTTTRYRSAYRYFFLDVDADDYFVYYSASRYVVIIPSGEIFVIVKDAEGGETYYASIEDAWAAAISSDPDGVNTIVLNADVSPTETLTVGSGEYLALDFNGHAINAPSPDSAIKVSGTLYLYDSTEVYAFGIEYEGDAAVVDNGDGTFTTYYATIADMDTGEKQWNSYTSGGITGHSDGVSVGAIHVSGAGVLNMYGGSVVLNGAGPGIYMTSGGGNPSLYMYGGSVSGNSNTEGGAAAIGSSNGYMYIYGGVIAANVTEGANGEIISADGSSSLYLGTDDEGILSYLEEINPDAYEAGVAISGNYVGKDGYDRLIYMSFSAKTFAMYDRVEISYNYQDASDRGFIQISAGTGYFYGGTIAWNTTGETYGVIQYVTRAYFYGDFFLGHNSTRVDAKGEEHGNLYGSSFRVDDSFTGVIYVSETTSENLRVTNGAVTEDIYGHVISDRGYCRRIETYLYFYYEHADEMILAYEDGVFVVYDVCRECGDILQRLVVGDGDNDY